ncbi:hypothetical protein QN277_025695 [Acacia crassicarpa]|uniref:Uncharacterized protein n=1 Tax=Acacia crassicarpa TaxID=499986 RepID=A0AAE1MJV8_9FABA|nr:hypothetical protein QN277_025695 [Acacia crassicarpa]
MSMFQQQLWKLRTRDVAVQEILRERREAIATGRLKGRRLFEPLQRRGTILNEVLSGDDEIGPESEVRSLSFDYSEDETYSPLSSSALPLLSCHSLDRDQEVKEEEEVQDVCNAEARVGNGGRYIIFLGVTAIVLLVFAIYKSWVRRFEEYEVILVPT